MSTKSNVNPHHHRIVLWKVSWVPASPAICVAKKLIKTVPLKRGIISISGRETIAAAFHIQEGACRSDSWGVDNSYGDNSVSNVFSIPGADGQVDSCPRLPVLCSHWSLLSRRRHSGISAYCFRLSQEWRVALYRHDRFIGSALPEQPLEIPGTKYP